MEINSAISVHQLIDFGTFHWILKNGLKRLKDELSRIITIFRRIGRREEAIRRNVEQQGAVGWQLFESGSQEDQQLTERRLVQQIFVRVFTFERSIGRFLSRDPKQTKGELDVMFTFSDGFIDPSTSDHRWRPGRQGIGCLSVGGVFLLRLTFQRLQNAEHVQSEFAELDLIVVVANDQHFLQGQIHCRAPFHWRRR